MAKPWPSHHQTIAYIFRSKQGHKKNHASASPDGLCHSIVSTVPTRVCSMLDKGSHHASFIEAQRARLNLAKSETILIGCNHICKRMSVFFHLRSYHMNSKCINVRWEIRVPQAERGLMALQIASYIFCSCDSQTDTKVCSPLPLFMQAQQTHV